MASAAAVAADISRSPLPDHEENEQIDTVGTITSADKGPSTLPARGVESEDEEDEDEDIRPKAGRRRDVGQSATTDKEDLDESMVNGDVENDDDDVGGGLFGSDDEEDEDDVDNEDPDSKKSRQLDDEDLDSGDDVDRDDRRMEDDELRDEQPQQEELSFTDMDMVRHPIPEPTDGEFYLLKVPRFLSIDPQPFDHETFHAPTTDHHSKTDPSGTFSAYNTAMSTIRWRRSPKDPSRLQSNARIVRWSDGSLTLQFAAKPKNHYQISGNALAPPQHNPPKPTPVSTDDNKRKLPGGGKSQVYNPELDAFTYLAAGHQRSGVLRITNKFTAGLKVQSATDASAEALELLQNQLAAANNATGDAQGSGIGMIRITEDPELAKKKAEIAEKETLKAQRRREAQEARDRERQGRVFGRRGPGLGGGLTVGGLEDEDGFGRGSGRSGGSKKHQPKRSRRGEIYSEDEEDYGRRGRTREDEYDQEDDFLAPSDEEEEVVESEEDDDDGIMEEPRRQKLQAGAPAARQVTPSGEQDAEGDPEEDTALPRAAAGSPGGGRKRRRVIEDDDEEE